MVSVAVLVELGPMPGYIAQDFGPLRVIPLAEELVVRLCPVGQVGMGCVVVDDVFLSKKRLFQNVTLEEMALLLSGWIEVAEDRDLNYLIINNSPEDFRVKTFIAQNDNPTFVV